jgi:hypothetical protein
MTKDEPDLEKILSRAEALLDQDIRSDLLDKMVRLAIEQGYEKVDTWRGCGYLLAKGSPRRPGEEYRVTYEIDVLFNPELMHASAYGCMVGNDSALQRALRSGGARLSYGMEISPAAIRIMQLERNRAFFSVLTPIGI